MITSEWQGMLKSDDNVVVVVDVNVDNDDDVDVEQPEEICLAGQLAILLYSSTKIASSSTLGHNKPEILSGIQSRRRNNLAISCILSSTFLPCLMSIIHFTLFLYIVQFSMEVTFTSKRDQLQKTLWTNSGLSPQ